MRREGVLGKYFGTDGFRGRANERLTAIHAFRVGRFLGRYFGRHKGGGRARIVVGKDTRLSSYMLEYALTAGATASGADVYLLHVTTTPSVSFVTRTEGFDCGVMISASHNPYYDNGIKLFGAGGEKLGEDILKLVEDYLDGGALPLATGEEVGRTVDFVAGRNRYLAYLLSLPRSSLRGMRVGLDCANGSAWALGRAVFDALGAQVVSIAAEPNGVNINQNCGSTHPAGLCALVKERALDVGFAFDGDGDRCVCADEKGELLDGDGILYVCARAMQKSGGLDGDRVVATVMSNAGLEKALARENISLIRTEVGDKLVCEEMEKSGAMLGGEPSGHIIFRKYAATGDGILTALRIAELVTESKCPLSYLKEGYRPLPRETRNVPAKNSAAALSSEAVKEAISRVEEGGGRVVVRASGTEPVVRILVEGEEMRLCAEGAAAIERAVLSAEEGI